MTDLGECRKRIEEIDLQMAELFEERMKVVKDIAEYKRAKGLPIRDPAREEELARKNSVRVKSDEIRPYYEEYLRDVIGISCEYQEKLNGTHEQ